MKTYVWTEWTNSFPPEHEGHFDGYKSSDLLVDGEWTGSVMRQHRRSFTAFPVAGGHHSHIESEDTAKAIVEKAAGREIEVPLDHRQLLWSLRENPRALGERDVRVLLDIVQSAKEDGEAMRELARSYGEQMDKMIADSVKEGRRHD